MPTRPNPLVLLALTIPMSLTVGAVIRVYQLDMVQSFMTALIGATTMIGVEQVIRRVLGLGLVADAHEKPELSPLPDLFTLILLIASIGAAVGVSGAMVSRFYGVLGNGDLPINVAIVAAACAFMGGMVRLIRHIVRLEIKEHERRRAMSDPRSDHSPIAAPHT